jgi:hypothetical protein
MSELDWARIRSLFQEALDCPPDERAAFVERESAGDEVLRREVASLLAAHDRAEGFLEGVAPAPPEAHLDTRPIVADIRSGCRLGAFELLELLGSGGMGEVYRARDTRLDRFVAVKVLSPEIARNPRSRERFEREARVVSQLTHPHICTLHDLARAHVNGIEVPFLVMELLDGETLATRLARGTLPLDETLRIAIEIAEALAAAHALGVVHRDLKPANIMLTASGVKLLDFGLAHWRGPVVADAGAAAVRMRALTTEGLVIGTLPYMAPEQVRGDEIDARTDLFAFGAMLYEMITGARAFAADSQAELLAAILVHEPTPITRRQPLAPPALDQLVTRCLAKAPADRWQHAHDVVVALKGIAERGVSQPRRRIVAHGTGALRPYSRAVTAALVVALLGLVIWYASSGGHTPASGHARPVVVLMDSPGRVYDAATAAAGGTNADDVSDALRDLPVLVYKENTSSMWHREEHVRRQNPDLIISHLSCLLDARKASADQALEDHLLALAESRLTLFFGYVATTNPRTRFLIYSRRHFATREVASAWVNDVVARFPLLRGRLFTMSMPGGRASATFRDPATVRLLREQVHEILALPRDASP